MISRIFLSFSSLMSWIHFKHRFSFDDANDDADDDELLGFGVTIAYVQRNPTTLSYNGWYRATDSTKDRPKFGIACFIFEGCCVQYMVKDGCSSIRILPTVYVYHYTWRVCVCVCVKIATMNETGLSLSTYNAALCPFNTVHGNTRRHCRRRREGSCKLHLCHFAMTDHHSVMCVLVLCTW